MKKFLSGLLALTIMFTFTACGSNSSNGTADDKTAGDSKEEAAAAEGDTIVIGGLAPLTGDVAVYGTTATNGVKLAFDEINKAGGVLGKQIEYKVLDEKGDETEAVNAYNKLLSDNIVALIGDITSKPSIAVAAEAASEGTPMVSPTATHPDVTTYGDNIFRVCFLDPFQGKTMAKFAAENLKAKKVAVLYNTSDDYSSGIAKSFKETAESLGLEVTAFEGHGAKDVDFKTQLTNISKTEPDALLIPDYYSQIALIAPQAKEVGLKATLLGADGWDGVVGTLDKGNLDVVENSYFCNHYSIKDESEKVQNFIKAYKETYNEEPSAFAALGYDAAYVVAKAIEEAGSTDQAAIVDALKNTSYDGVTGSMKFDEDGNPIKAVLIIKIVNGEYTFDSVVQPE